MSIDLRSACVCTLWLLLSAGCGGDSLPRMGVSGTVKVKGSPLAQGAISFIPVESGPASGGAVTDGEFSIAASRGPVAGKYKVRVTVEGEKQLNPRAPMDEDLPQVMETELEISDATTELNLEF